MDFNIEVRKKQLQSLDQYITSSKDKVQWILDYLGWNAKYTKEKRPNIICSINHRHSLDIKNANAHLKKCHIKTLGYHSDDEFLSEPANDPLTSIKLDNTEKIAIFNKARENVQGFRTVWNGQDPDPMTSERLFTTYSSDERLALYNYSVQNTDHPPIPSEFNIQIEEKTEDKFLTSEEILAKQRDAKRRRIKYKSVHTGRNKSYTEVIREVIANQMEQYKEYVENKIQENSCHTEVDFQINNEQSLYHTNIEDIIKKEVIHDNERPGSSVSRHSNNSGSSRSKTVYSKHENSQRNHSYDSYRRDFKEHDKRSDYNSKYDSSPYGSPIKKEVIHDNERPSSSVSRHSNNSGSSRSKTVYSKHENSQRNHSSDSYRRDFKEHDKRGDYNSKYDSSPYKESSRRHKDSRDNYKQSRDKRERYYKFDKRPY